MPLKFHKMAQPSARAALAAQEQGKFWEFHDSLFAAQSSLSKETINKIAQDLNLDIQKFEQDMASPKIQAQINKDLMAAEKARVSGTPTVFINGRLLKERSPEGFQAIINDELQKLGEKK